MDIPLTESDDDLDESIFADSEVEDDDTLLEQPCSTRDARPVRSRRDLERYMEERALERELNSWWQ